MNSKENKVFFLTLIPLNTEQGRYFMFKPINFLVFGNIHILNFMAAAHTKKEKRGWDRSMFTTVTSAFLLTKLSKISLVVVVV